MCGITGFFTKNYQEDQSANLKQMTRAIAHRGPDAVGSFTNKDAGIYLGHRRLSILDLSINGAQPMSSESERYTISFNGEIYNYIDLREELIREYSLTFKSDSDTEVLINGIEKWGIEKTLKKLNGMFAFALWDAEMCKLTLARDRIGIKPLYYSIQNNVLIFGSQLKPMTFFKGFEKRISKEALGLFFRHNYIPAPYSIYENTKKLMPGTFLTFNKDLSFEQTVYWSPRKACYDIGEFQGSYDQAKEHLSALLKDSVEKRMISHVPLGAFLSGGIDSSLITAMMKEATTKSVKTFTIGFKEDSHNEAEYAKRIAEYLDTDHTELYVTPKEAFDVIYELPKIYDEPFSDSSQIPTFLVSKLTRQKVTVSLSGDGGDELFMGYHRYRIAAKARRQLSVIPGFLREHTASILNGIRGTKGDHIPGNRVSTAARLLSNWNEAEFYEHFISHNKDPHKMIRGLNRNSDRTFKTRFPCLLKNNFIRNASFMDLNTYLPDDVLVKVDRASMAVGLEVRVPILDHRIVEFAYSLPTEMKYRRGQQKYILKDILFDMIPSKLLKRKKMGFGVPVIQWMKGPMKDWARELIYSNTLKDDELLNDVKVKEIWEGFIEKDIAWGYLIWDIVSYLAWKREADAGQ
ncbi:asparagine synthase (glutamine-hydrolyzing) [bacterium]|nr:asparagine synthase (glutamine-hydrolyzing) [bacterium]